MTTDTKITLNFLFAGIVAIAIVLSANTSLADVLIAFLQSH